MMQDELETGKRKRKKQPSYDGVGEDQSEMIEGRGVGETEACERNKEGRRRVRNGTACRKRPDAPRNEEGPLKTKGE